MEGGAGVRPQRSATWPWDRVPGCPAPYGGSVPSGFRSIFFSLDLSAAGAWGRTPWCGRTASPRRGTTGTARKVPPPSPPTPPLSGRLDSPVGSAPHTSTQPHIDRAESTARAARDPKGPYTRTPTYIRGFTRILMNTHHPPPPAPPPCGMARAVLVPTGGARGVHFSFVAPPPGIVRKKVDSTGISQYFNRHGPDPEHDVVACLYTASPPPPPPRPHVVPQRVAASRLRFCGKPSLSQAGVRREGPAPSPQSGSSASWG